MWLLSSCAVLLAGALCLAQELAANRQAQLERGKKVFHQCGGCHLLDTSGEAATGPNLYGVVGRKVGKQADFTYSAALLEKNVTWTEQELDNFLKSPADYADGTTMAYSGLKDPADRKALIEYLKSMAPARKSTNVKDRHRRYRGSGKALGCESRF